MVFAFGFTVINNGLLLANLLVVVVPSEYVTFQGAIPVNATDKVAEFPVQIVWVPLSVAVPAGCTVTNPVPDTVPVHVLTSFTLFKVYVVVAVGLTVMVAGLELIICV